MLAKVWTTLTEINWTVFNGPFTYLHLQKGFIKRDNLTTKIRTTMENDKISFIIVLYVEFWITLLNHNELA